MKTRRDQTITLMPMRLELRRLHGEVKLTSVKVPTAPEVSENDEKNTTISYGLASFPQAEYWIRWYPDDHSVFSPPKAVSDEEAAAYRKLIEVYEKQREYSRHGEVAVRAVNQNFIETSAGGDASIAEEILQIHNGFKPGRLTSQQIEACGIYNAAAIEAILSDNSENPHTVGVRIGWHIYDLENPVLDRIWREFEEQFGPVRARYIASFFLGRGRLDKRIAVSDGLETFGIEGLKLLFLPPELCLYTVKDLVPEPLAEVKIPRPEQVVVAPAGVQLRRDGPLAETETPPEMWAFDFATAVEEGMGVKIKESQQVAQIDEADWLIVFGVNETKNRDTSLEHILRGLRSRGKCAIVPQDSPTNNTEGAPVPYAGLETDLGKYLNDTRLRIDHGDFQDEHPQLLSSPPLDVEERIEQRTLDSQILAHALEVDPAVFSEIPGAALEEYTAAGAAAKLIFPCCTTAFRKVWSKILNAGEDDPLWEELESFFVQYVRARGSFPVLRAGNNPYGVLPVSNLEDWKASLSKPEPARALQTWVSRVSQFLLSDFQRLAEDITTLNTANQGEQYQVLLEILRRTRLSKRVDVRLSVPSHQGRVLRLGEDAHFLRCHLVCDDLNGMTSEDDGLAYLRSLGEWSSGESLEILPILNPLMEEGRVGPSLLHRLLSTYLFRIQETDGQEVLDEQRALRLKKVAGYLGRLHPDSLEILLMEVLDSMFFRLDAWITALSTVRFYECRSAQEARSETERTYSPIGVYGWLERPGQHGPSIESEEYIQAPSLGQAAVGALVRNAARNSGYSSEQFQINLSSSRVRLGLWYMEGLRRGHLPGELLGYRLERMIKEEAARQADSADPEKIKESDIYELRDTFPLSAQRAHESGARNVVATVVDGRAFLDEPDKRPIPRGKFDEIAQRLETVRDAVADIAVGEATHHFMRGNVAATTSWMDFFDGNALPPESEFLRSFRTGKTTTTSLFLHVPVTNEPSNVNGLRTLEVADANLWRLAQSLMPNWGEERVRICFGHKEKEERKTVDLFLKNDLRLTPADLIVGETNEVLQRARCFLIGQWKAETSSTGATSIPYVDLLGKYPSVNETTDVLEVLSVDLLPPQEAGRINSLPGGCLEIGQTLRQVLQRSRRSMGLIGLDPGKGDAPDFIPQEERNKVDWSKSVERIFTRGKLLLEIIETLIGNGNDKGELVKLFNKEADELLDAFADPFSSFFLVLGEIGFPEALRVLPNPDPRDLDALVNLARKRLDSIIRRLRKRREKLKEQDVLYNSASSLHEKALLAVEFLCVAIGRPGLPVLFPYVHSGSGWTMEFAGPETTNPFPLDLYKKTRKAVREATMVLKTDVGFARHVHTTSNGDMEIVFGRSTSIDREKALTLVLDRWSEFIPNHEETTGVAFHYNTPKAQAPNAILIGVPPEFREDKSWDVDLLAKTLTEVLRLMQIRMVGSQEIIGDNNLGKHFPWSYFALGKFLVFPYASRLLEELDFGEPYRYKLASKLNQKDLEVPDAIAERVNNPELGVFNKELE